MTSALPVLRPIHLVVALLIAALGAVLIAQIEGERGIAPIASSGDFEVRDVHVDIYGPTAEAARTAGWKQAQRLAWRQLWTNTNGGTGPMLPDSTLDAMVSGIVVDQEQIGPNRYIATLNVMFDRARAGQALGVTGQSMRSPPLLVIPVLTDAGVSSTFETPTDWQRAWAMFRTADSAIDYVRPVGDGPDPLLLDAGQINRRGRNWWRILLDEYGAADVIMPLARLERSWPGGPVTGKFAARYGPDNHLIGTFTLRAEKSADIPAMLETAVQRMDALYSQALFNGTLRPDPSLVIEEPVNAVELDNVSDLSDLLAAMPSEEGGDSGTATSLSIQFETPTAESVSAAETMMRGLPGVRLARTASLALGGMSVMTVNVDGSPDALRGALEARGYTVSGSGTTWRIVRRGQGGAPQ